MAFNFKELVGWFTRLLLRRCSHLRFQPIISFYPSVRTRTIQRVGLTSPIAFTKLSRSQTDDPDTHRMQYEMTDLWNFINGSGGLEGASRSPHASSDGATSQEDSPSKRVADHSFQRKRKAQTTYYARKDEMKELQEESEELAQRLAELQERQRQRSLPLQQTVSLNASLLSQLEYSRRAIAVSQLLMGSAGAEQAKQLLGCYIHLPADPADRKRLLIDMKPKKIQDALEYLLQRSQFLDLRLPTRQIENCATADGHHLTYHWEICTFKGNSLSAEHIFHDMLYFVRNQEMEMAEKLGMFNIRESDVADDVIDATQIRIVSANSKSYVEEKNIVLHSQFFTRSARLGQPHGVFCADFVDKDDAFPYRPEARVRKDITVAALTIECPRTHPNEPHTVALVRWAQLKVHDSPLATFEELETLARDNIAGYFDSMTRVIRERIAWRRANIVDASTEEMLP